MSQFTLGYQKIRGLVESIRLLFHYLEIEYKEVLYEFYLAPDFSLDSWFSVKYKLGFDYMSIPYLIDGDFKMTKSNAIWRYICEKYKSELLGETIKEKNYVNMTIGVLADLLSSKGMDCPGNEIFKNTMKV